MVAEDHQETTWENLRLVVERRPEHWQVFVYDFENCEILHTAERPNAHAAKMASVEFAMAYTYGPGHHLNISDLAEMLVWEPG